MESKASVWWELTYEPKTSYPDPSNCWFGVGVLSRAGYRTFEIEVGF